MENHTMIPTHDRSRETFEQKMKSTKARNTVITINTVLNNFEKFSLEQFDQKDIIPDLKAVPEETLWDTLQQWINYNSDKNPSTVKLWFSIIKKYLHHRGVKLNPDDVKENLDFPRKMTEDPHPLQLSEINRILLASNYKKKVMYMCQISSGMRIGELVQIRKKHLVFGKKRIMVKIPSYIAKFNKARTTFFSIEAQKLLMPILRKKLEDELIFGSNDDMRKAEVNEMQTLKRTLQKVGLYQKNESNGRGTITSHSFRAYFITKLSRRDPNFAKKLAGQKGYLLQYDRLSDDEKLEVYLKFESDLILDDSKIIKNENEQQKSLKNQIDEMKEELEELKYGATGRRNNYNQNRLNTPNTPGAQLLATGIPLLIELLLPEEKKRLMMKEFLASKKENRPINPAAYDPNWEEEKKQRREFAQKLVEHIQNSPELQESKLNDLKRPKINMKRLMEDLTLQ